MRLNHIYASRVVMIALTCSALPAMAANCAAVAGEHYGKFSADKKRGSGNLPSKIEGTWKAKIDKSCAITGTVTSDLTGTVQVKGDYGVYRGTANIKAFDSSNLFMQEAQPQKYQNFAFGSDSPGTNYVNIVDGDKTYWGSFVVEK
jgi:hypothetical protein